MDDDQAQIVIGLMLEVFYWLHDIMPEGFDLKAANDRIDRILDGSS